MARPTLPRPTDGEVQILQTIWTYGPLSVTGIYEILHPEGSKSINSILKRVQIMEEKGYIKRSDGRPLVYHAVLTEQKGKAHLIKDLVKRVFGSNASLVLHALEGQKVSPAEREKIKKALSGRKS